jgi:hypothetical protein
MNKFTFISLIVLLSIVSCDNANQKTNLIEQETEPIEQESKTEDLEDLESKRNYFESKGILDIERNLVQGENKKFLIRVDRLSNGELIYRSWSKPKTIADKPDLKLSNGVIDKQGTGGGYHFIFKNGAWKYIIENNLMGESDESVGLFMRLLQNDKERLYSRLNDITIDTSQKDAYKKSDLIGRWWTPHYAVRKIEFFDNNRFRFNDGDDNISIGNFTFSNRKVTLLFDTNEKNIVMELGGGNNDYSYTLVGEGENFVNER